MRISSSIAVDADFEMNLIRVGDTHWPAGDPVPTH